jgi:hypothetical protein
MIEGEGGASKWDPSLAARFLALKSAIIIEYGMEDKGISLKEKIDLVVAIGPVPMMKFVSKLTKEYNVPTMVSLNPIMVDGTGMCGGCRVTVDGTTRFACVDGPEFDGHQVDFEELMRRNRSFVDLERIANADPAPGPGAGPCRSAAAQAVPELVR